MKRSAKERQGKSCRPPNPLAGQQRDFRRTFAMGGASACVRCGLQAPAALRRVPAGLFEEHHPLGRQHDPGIAVVVCASCHAILSAGQVDDDVRLTQTPTSFERVVAVVGALGSHLRELGEALLAWALRGRGMIEGLDRDYEGWRDKPWAK